MRGVVLSLAFVSLVVSGCASGPKARAKKFAEETPETRQAIDASFGVAPKAAVNADLSNSVGAGLDFPIIDAHTHTFFAENPVDQKSPIELPLKARADFENELQKAGVVATVAHLVEGDFGYDAVSAKKNVLYCGSVKKVGEDTSRIEQGLKNGKYGCIKVYLGYVHTYAYDAGYEPLYKLALKYDVPVVFHTGDTYTKDGMLKYADPLTLDEVAVKHPKMRIVIAHCGNPWIQSAAEVAYKNENVYLDGSALMIGNLDEQPSEKVEEYMIKPLSWIFGYVENPSKLMFGTDWPLTNIAAYVKAFKKAIPKEHWRAVFYENAFRVFPRLHKFDQKEGSKK